eukprot:gene21093-23154_t
MLDEMSIRKHVPWDGKRFRGYVDLGNDCPPDDSSPIAKNVLVLMAVCVNGSWKVPCGYFFIDGLSGVEKANIVKVCIERLADTGAIVSSLICDGSSCHFTMMQELGASLHYRRKGFKSALRKSNKWLWEPFLNEAASYIENLTDAAGQPMSQGRRKTGFIGFLAAIKSTKEMFHEFV